MYLLTIISQKKQPPGLLPGGDNFAVPHHLVVIVLKVVFRCKFFERRYGIIDSIV